MGRLEVQMQVSYPEPAHPNPLFELLGNERRVVRFRKRKLIFAAGNPSDAVFLIEHGGVKLTLTSPDGREAVVAIFCAGDLFGYEAFDSANLPRVTNAIALTDVRLARIDRVAILRAMASRPAIHALVISLLIHRIAHLKYELAGNLLCTSEQRLARALLLTAEIDHSDPGSAMPKISQQELADMIGTTRQRVNCLLQRFRKMGLINDSHGLHLNELLRNVAQLD
ncbi:MAG TPA: Crp/Fnr family transcriptional regulator [Terriglobales bacterium]|nr:Crp/Fnr family transcriptional regulator [Terriglobales bacterium]